MPLFCYSYLANELDLASGILPIRKVRKDEEEVN